MKWTDIIPGVLVLVVLAVAAWFMRIDDAPAPAPDFGCTQTISSTDARRIASDLHRYSSEGDSVEFYFECQGKFTLIRLERVR